MVRGRISDMPYSDNRLDRFQMATEVGKVVVTVYTFQLASTYVLLKKLVLFYIEDSLSFKALYKRQKL